MTGENFMRLAEIEMLRCPFCGNPFSIEPDAPPREGELRLGMLACQCCAYPVVDGIPYLQTDGTAKQLLALIHSGNGDSQGRNETALDIVLGLDGLRRERFHSLLNRARPATFREALELFSPDLEGAYFFYRFSDPTFVISDLLLRVMAENSALFEGPVLDACGGTGHLTRTLAQLASPGSAWLADLHFWKIWLARKFLAPDCVGVCCDAANPLPFASGTFSLVFCSGAFEYIWPRRLFAGEMARSARREGAVVITHTHNALCDNPSPGMPLTPRGYCHLFDERPLRLFSESAVLDAFLQAKSIDLSQKISVDDLEQEPALILISSSHEKIFRTYHPPALPIEHGNLATNPLYTVEQSGDSLALTLQFPSEFYRDEFRDCLRYLPQHATLSREELKRWQSGELNGRAVEWMQRRVLLHLPVDYL
jgi:SAM-dependent methyltransferase/uncharacterized protein YbaR (Trm112 family)